MNDNKTFISYALGDFEQLSMSCWFFLVKLRKSGHFNKETDTRNMHPGSFIQMIILDEFKGCFKNTIEDLADQIQHFMIRLASSQLSMTLRLWITFNSR